MFTACFWHKYINLYTIKEQEVGRGGEGGFARLYRFALDCGGDESCKGGQAGVRCALPRPRRALALSGGVGRVVRSAMA